MTEIGPRPPHHCRVVAAAHHTIACAAAVATGHHRRKAIHHGVVHEAHDTCIANVGTDHRGLDASVRRICFLLALPLYVRQLRLEP
jgi:hypothetical protein